MCEIVLLFAVLCYLADREVIIIPLLLGGVIPGVSQRTFTTKGLISIEGTFFGTPCTVYHVHLYDLLRNLPARSRLLGQLYGMQDSAV